MKRELFCTIILVIVFVMPGRSGAWFSENRDDRPFLGRAMSHSGLPSGDLAVYDDISAGTARILMPVSSFFIPVDTINLDIPLTLLAQAPFNSMDSLDRLMSANLRLSLLIDEYKALQKRAEKLLKSVSIPYLDAPWHPEKADIASVNDLKKTLDSRLDGILLHGRAISLKHADNPDLSALSLRERSLLLISSNRSLENSNLPFLNLDAKDMNSVQNSEAAKNGGGLSSVTSLPHDKTLPWIIEFFIDVFSYCLSHRIEVLFYVTVLLLIGYFLSLRVKTHE